MELAEPGHYDEKWQNWKLESLRFFLIDTILKLQKIRESSLKLLQNFSKRQIQLLLQQIATEKVKISPGRLSIKQMPFQKIKHLKDYGSIA